MADDARLSPQDVYAKIAELVHFLSPGACNLKLRYDSPAGRCVLAIPDGATVPKLATLKTNERLILEVLKASHMPLNAKAIARKVSSGTLKTYKGTFGRTLNRMVSSGVLFKSGGLYTDDPRKFENTDF